MTIPQGVFNGSEPHPCTCHPDDNPPVPCAQRYAYSECVAHAAITKEIEQRRARIARRLSI
jgi:hypothetical protein